MACITEPEAELIGYVNQFRAQHGLMPLQVSAILMDSAQQWADYIAKHDYWPANPHNGPDGSTHTSRAHVLGYPSDQWVGGNLLWGQMTAWDAFDAWAKSAPHRDNMLGNYREIGVALISEPVWDYAGDVFAAACMDLSNGTTTLAVQCNGEEPVPPPIDPPTDPVTPVIPRPRHPVTPVVPPPIQDRRRRRRLRRILRRIFGRSQP